MFLCVSKKNKNFMFNKVTIVGVGLISGSFAIALKEKGFAKIASMAIEVI